MCFLKDDFVFSIHLSTAWCSPRYKCNAFINFHNSPFMVVPLLAKLFIAFVKYYISRRPSARPLKTTYRPSCSRIHITKDTRKYFNLHTKKPLINLFVFSFKPFFFHFFLFSIISSLTEAPKRKQFLGMMHRPFLEAVQLNHILWFWKTKCLWKLGQESFSEKEKKTMSIPHTSIPLPSPPLLSLLRQSYPESI